jgi:CheY-like chemotaxis protein
VRALRPEQGGRTPALALTAYARPDDELRALGAGFEYHLAKPLVAERLLEKVFSLAERAQR